MISGQMVSKILNIAPNGGTEWTLVLWWIFMYILDVLSQTPFVLIVRLAEGTFVSFPLPKAYVAYKKRKSRNVNSFYNHSSFSILHYWFNRGSTRFLCKKSWLFLQQYGPIFRQSIIVKVNLSPILVPGTDMILKRPLWCVHSVTCWAGVSGAEHMLLSHMISHGISAGEFFVARTA